jgi:hypothetical protein
VIELLPSGLNLYSHVSGAHTKYQNQLQFIALQSLDVAAQIVGKVFVVVVVVGARDHARVRVVVKGGAAQTAEVVVGVGHDLRFATAYARGDLMKGWS